MTRQRVDRWGCLIMAVGLAMAIVGSFWTVYVGTLLVFVGVVLVGT